VKLDLDEDRLRAEYPCRFIEDAANERVRAVGPAGLAGRRVA